jgi:6-phosphogluconolactonase
MKLSLSWVQLAGGPVLLPMLLAAFAAEARGAAETKQHVYIGTYTGAKSQGIYHAVLDPATGKLSEPELAAEAVNPSFLNIHPTQKFLYAVNREGEKQGGLLAFAIDRRTGKLTRLGDQAACGDGPCHVMVDRSGKCVLVASYGSGMVGALPIHSDGSLSDTTGLIQHADPPNSDAPRMPHAHSMNVDLENRIVVAADLGLDQLRLYRLDPAAAKLTPHDPPFVVVKAGSGPRHFAFHPSGKFAYSNMEHTSRVIAFSYDPARGVLSELESLSTLPADFEGPNSTAEIQVHPNGRLLFVSNRGHNTIAGFAVDPATGRLTALGHTPAGGKVPRNFCIDPSGQYLLAANQETNNVVVFRIDAQTGKLAPTGQSIEVGAPVCVKFVPAE